MSAISPERYSQQKKDKREWREGEFTELRKLIFFFFPLNYENGKFYLAVIYL